MSFCHVDGRCRMWSGVGTTSSFQTIDSEATELTLAMCNWLGFVSPLCPLCVGVIATTTFWCGQYDVWNGEWCRWWVSCLFSYSGSHEDLLRPRLGINWHAKILCISFKPFMVVVWCVFFSYFHICWSLASIVDFKNLLSEKSLQEHTFLLPVKGRFSNTKINGTVVDALCHLH